MTPKDQVSREAYERSHAVPSAWVATFRWATGWAFNQEDGLTEGPVPMPSRDDVEQGQWLVFGWKG